jgi:predicted enzyme related to lactoylglutathione lyase
MQALDLVILFVENPLKSAAFYSLLLEKKPLEESSTFALFGLPNGTQLGLWSKHTAEPKVQLTGGGSEIAFSVENVDTTYEKWQSLHVQVAQVPTDMDFGRTFVVLDPDGHRIRVYKVW